MTALVVSVLACNLTTLSAPPHRLKRRFWNRKQRIPLWCDVHALLVRPPPPFTLDFLRQVAACLAELLTKHADEGLRSMACVLLRQLCVARELWFAIPRPFQEIVKSNLITWCVHPSRLRVRPHIGDSWLMLCCFCSLRADPSPQVRRRACWVIAQVCSNIPDGESCESSWAKVILPLCFEAIRAPEASHRLIGFFLLSKVLEFSPDEVSALIDL